MSSLYSYVYTYIHTYILGCIIPSSIITLYFYLLALAIRFSSRCMRYVRLSYVSVFVCMCVCSVDQRMKTKQYRVSKRREFVDSLQVSFDVYCLYYITVVGLVTVC